MGFSTILLTITTLIIIALIGSVTYLVIHNYKNKRFGKGHFES